ERDGGGGAEARWTVGEVKRPAALAGARVPGAVLDAGGALEVGCGNKANPVAPPQQPGRGAREVAEGVPGPAAGERVLPAAVGVVGGEDGDAVAGAGVFRHEGRGEDLADGIARGGARVLLDGGEGHGHRDAGRPGGRAEGRRTA